MPSYLPSTLGSRFSSSHSQLIAGDGLPIADALPPCSANTGAYCKARARLSEAVVRELTYQVGETVEDQAPDAWRWHGRRVLLQGLPFPTEP